MTAVDWIQLLEQVAPLACVLIYRVDLAKFTQIISNDATNKPIVEPGQVSTEELLPQPLPTARARYKTS